MTLPRTALIGTALVVSALFLVSWTASPAAAEEPGAGEPDGEEKEYPNAVELFLGGVTESEATGFGIGIEYNHRIARKWSLGVEIIEISTFETERSWLVVAVGYFHATESLVLKAGAGVEGATGEPEEGAEDTEGESSTEFAVRLGAGWDFELSPRFSITPEINVDLVGSDVTYVYGLSFGVHF